MRPAPEPKKKQGDIMPGEDQDWLHQIGKMLSQLQYIFQSPPTFSSFPGTGFIPGVTSRVGSGMSVPPIDKAKEDLKQMLAERYGISPEQYDSWTTTPEGAQIIHEIFSVPTEPGKMNVLERK